MFLLSNSFYAQTSQTIRSNIYTFSQADQVLLNSLMLNYIDKKVIEDHCLVSSLSGITGGGIHSDFDFLRFHRAYVEEMEDWLILRGYPQFVPLPYWDVTFGGSPQAFRFVDTDCQFACTKNCAPIVNWNVAVTRPNYL